MQDFNIRLTRPLAFEQLPHKNRKFSGGNSRSHIAFADDEPDFPIFTKFKEDVRIKFSTLKFSTLFPK